MSKVLKVVAVVALAVAVVVFAPAIGAALSSVIGSLGIATVSAAAVSSWLIGMAITTALTATASLFRKAPSMSNSMADRLSGTVNPTAPRKIVFGLTAAGNDVRFFETYGKKKDRYAQVVALASHKVNAIKGFYVENDLRWAPGGFVRAGGFEKISGVVEGRPGNGFSLGTGSYWRNTASFTGCAYLALTWKLSNDDWPNGLPSSTRTIVEGCPLYDPRQDSTSGGQGNHRPTDQNTWAWRTSGGVEIGRNPALALLTYLIGYRINGTLVWGMGIPLANINLDSFRTYANVCEERVATQFLGTVQRYTCDGIFSTADGHETVINGITAAMGSTKLVDVGGAYTLIGGYDDTAGPKVSLSADDLVGAAGSASPYIWSPAPASRERFNIIRGRFADPDNLYQLSDWGDPIEQPALADMVPRTMTLDLGCVSRPETCQRIAKQFLLREYKTPGKFSATFGPNAFAAQVGSLVTLTIPKEGWNAKLFRVEEQAETHDMFYQMTLREESAEIYAWDREEKPLPPNIRPEGYNPNDTLTPENLSLTSESYEGANHYNVSEVHVSWTPEDSGRVSGIHIQSRPVGVDGWSEQAALHDANSGNFIFTSNAPGIQVEVRARFRMSNAIYGPWVNATVATAPVTVITDWENITDESGTRPAPNADVTGDNTSKDTNAVGGKPAQEIRQELEFLRNGGLLDSEAPETPTGLAVTSTLTDNGASLKASWTARTEADLAGYIVAVREGTGPFTETYTSGISYEWPNARRNTTYEVKVSAYDKSSNRSAFSTPVAHVTARDETPPAPPTGISGDAGFNFIGLSWNNPDDADLSHVEIWTAQTNNVAQATRIAVAGARPSTRGSHIQSGLEAGSTHYFWLKAVDTSDNVSPFSLSSGPIQTAFIDISDVAPEVNQGITRTVDVLPDPQGYTGPTLVLLRTDSKLYRYVNGAWSKEVEAADLSGVVIPSQIDTRGLDIKNPAGVTMFSADGMISPDVLVGYGDNYTVKLSTVASNSLTPSLNFVGEYTTPPTQGQLGADWKQNAVYKNSLDGHSYVLSGEPLDWVIYLSDGNSFYVLVESSNGTVFRPGQATDTILKARLFKNGAEITDQVPDHWFGWRRVSGIPRPAPEDDATFNARYRQGYKQILVNIDDIYARATFFVDVSN